MIFSPLFFVETRFLPYFFLDLDLYYPGSGRRGASEGWWFILLGSPWASKEFVEKAKHLFFSAWMLRAALGRSSRMFLTSTAALHCVVLLLPFLLGHLPGYRRDGHFLALQRMVPALALQQQWEAQLWATSSLWLWFQGNRPGTDGRIQLFSPACCRAPCSGIMTCPGTSHLGLSGAWLWKQEPCLLSPCCLTESQGEK